MIVVIQRVQQANIEVAGKTIASMQQGLLCLVGIEREDTQLTIEKCIKKLLKLRIFADHGGKMNLSCESAKADLMLVPQFTLAADITNGHRPSFSRSAPPEISQPLFDALILCANEAYPEHVHSGQFGADMQVHLINDGPVTFTLQID